MQDISCITVAFLWRSHLNMPRLRVFPFPGDFHNYFALSGFIPISTFINVILPAPFSSINASSPHPWSRAAICSRLILIGQGAFHRNRQIPCPIAVIHARHETIRFYQAAAHRTRSWAIKTSSNIYFIPSLSAFAGSLPINLTGL